MSAPLAGKFQDHYKVLEVDPKSSLEAIQQAYGKLAQKYHPRNTQSGEQAKFDAVNLAYEVLSDQGLRTEFDKLRSGGEEKTEFNFSGLDFFAALGRETALRSSLLCILYDRRRLKPFTPGLPMRRIEAMLETTSEGLNFALWYLKQRNLVTSDDKSNLLITVEGMDYLETNPPTPESIMPLIRAIGLAGPKKESTAGPVLTGSGPSNVKRIFEALARS
jgi:DnaJ-like protein